MSQTKLIHIPLKQIRHNPSGQALRGVKNQTEKYHELVESIRKVGVLNAISVRQVSNPENPDEPLYVVIEGTQRTSASIDAGKETIPAQVLDQDESQVLEAQIIGNLVRIETEPAEYSKQLHRILRLNPDMTEAELAKRVCQSPAWLSQRLSLTKLTEPIQKLVNENRINLSNAVALSKVPPEMQAEFVQRAMTEQSAVFVPDMQKIVKQHRDALRAGQDPNKAQEYIHVPRLQSMSDIKQAYENSKAFADQLIAQEAPATSADLVHAVLAWVLKSDKTSIETGKAKWERDVAERKAKRDAAAAERAAKKQEAAEAAQKEAMAFQPIK